MADTIKTKRITDLPEDTDVNDNDLFMAGSNGTASLRKKKWSTILSKIKSKLLANNLTTTAEGYALDARQGKALKDQVDQLNTKISDGGSGYVKLPDGTMIQYGFFASTLLTNSYKNATLEVDFPHGFAGTAPVSVQITLASTQYLNGCSVDTITLSGFRAILMGAPEANTAYESGFRWLAVGRWK